MFLLRSFSLCSQLGKMYAVIGRRHGKILSADLMQGSGTFMVRAVLPVIESYNFAQEIRKQTSGLAYPQLMFSHWEVSASTKSLSPFHFANIDRLLSNIDVFSPFSLNAF